MSQQEVGERLGISQMHVSRLQHRALTRLKHMLSRER
jgi:RNA polymerase sigma-B factor